MNQSKSCPFCFGSKWEEVFYYSSPPKGETRFSFIKDSEYRRWVLCCTRCGHFISSHGMSLGELYNGEYVNATYQNSEGLRKHFDRINSLSKEESDNYGRVQRVCSFIENHFTSGRPRRLLDIGSGLAVFPYAMKQNGWECTALDPDPRAADHARDVAGIKAICANFLYEQIPERFPLISLNKVLEHVPEPLEMLQKAVELLEKDAIIYLELPDGEIARWEGAEREEFAIEHLHVFSTTSVSLMVTNAGLSCLTMQRLREPSGKFTIVAFLASPRSSFFY